MICSMRGRCVGSDPRLARRFLTRSACLTLGLDLLGLLEPQQQLIDRQALGPAPEAMALQLLDDLA